MVATKTFAFILLFYLPMISHCTKYPNDIDGSPEIECNDGNLRIAIKTTNGVASRIFAKGHFSNTGCTFERTNSASFVIGLCGMNRQRQLDPRGITYAVTVVIQLHPLFVTKVDRAYNVKCFYLENDKIVTSLLDVSMISTQAVTIGAPMPTCTYELHSESPSGPSARYARVGDPVWHVWTCPSPTFGILVHSCFVADGEGNQFRILDEKGCGIDQYVLRTPEYSRDLTTVQQETHVFKFADKTALVFNCQIKLCSKAGGGCNGITPPPCAGGNFTGNETEFNGTFFGNATNLEGGNGTGIGIGLRSSVPPPVLNASEHGMISENATLGSTIPAELNTTGQIIANGTTPSINGTHGLNFTMEHNEGTINRTEINANATEAHNVTNLNTTEHGMANVTHMGMNETDEGHNVTGHPAVGPPAATPNETDHGSNGRTPTGLPHSPGPGGTIGVNEKNATDIVIEEVTPTARFLRRSALDNRGRRNTLNNIQSLMQREAKALLEAEAIQEDAQSIPIRHDKHIGGGQIFEDDALLDGNIETDVSQSMWVLEPDDGLFGAESDNGHRIHPLELPSSTNFPDTEDSTTGDGSSKPQQASNGVCLSAKILWAIIIPMLLLMIITIIAVITCVLRARANETSNSMLIRQLFTHIYKADH